MAAPTSSQALDRNIAAGTDVALSMALKDLLGKLEELQREVGLLRRKLEAIETKATIRDRA